MPFMPPFLAPSRHADAESALAQVQLIYDQQIAHLREAMRRFVAGETPPGRMLMQNLFDLPDLHNMDDGIANGTWRHQPGQSQPLALFTAARVDYSLHRLRHYTGTAPDWFQNFVLFTNYQFYIDEFVRLGHEEMASASSDYTCFVEPGNVVTRRTGLPGESNDSLGAVPPRLP